MRALLLVVAVLTATQVFASTIVLTTEHHYVARSDRSAMAAKATSFKEYRDLQMERYRNDPTRIEPIFNALDRALLSGSIDDARALLSLGIDRMEARQG